LKSASRSRKGIEESIAGLESAVRPQSEIPGVVKALRDAEAGCEQQPGQGILPYAAGGEVNGKGIKGPDPGRNPRAAHSEGIFGAEVNRDAGEGAQQAVDGEDDESRGQRIDAEELENNGEQCRIERRLDGGGPADGIIRRAESMTAGQRARNPAHLPAELLVVFIRVGQVAISEADHHQADGKGHKNDDGKKPAG